MLYFVGFNKLSVTSRGRKVWRETLQCEIISRPRSQHEPKTSLPRISPASLCPDAGEMRDRASIYLGALDALMPAMAAA